jgi:hypothetical protein
MGNNEQLKQTEIVVVIDRSGSMASIGEATVNGFNTFLNEQKNSEGEAFLTLIQFDDRYEVNYKSLPIKEVNELILNETYVPRGTTALYESIGRTIQELDTKRDVVFVIITDGHDNVKSEFKPEAINKMINTLQDENGYKFIFLAANQDAISAGGALGIKASNSMSYAASAQGVTNVFTSTSKNLKSYRMSKMDLFSSDALVSMASMDNLSKTLDYDDEQRTSSMDDKKSK